jgi:hypothetical protein
MQPALVAQQKLAAKGSWVHLQLLPQEEQGLTARLQLLLPIWASSAWSSTGVKMLW